MPDITSISAAVSGLKNAIDLAKAMKASIPAIEKAEANYKFAELLDALSEVKMQMADIKEILAERDAEIKGLKERLELKGKMIFEHPFRWLIEGTEKEGPYCPKCYEHDGKAIHLTETGINFWKCMACQNSYDGERAKPGKGITRTIRRDEDDY